MVCLEHHERQQQCKHRDKQERHPQEIAAASPYDGLVGSIGSSILRACARRGHLGLVFEHYFCEVTPIDFRDFRRRGCLLRFRSHSGNLHLG
eukprot:g73470.t1